MNFAVLRDGPGAGGRAPSNVITLSPIGRHSDNDIEQSAEENARHRLQIKYQDHILKLASIWLVNRAVHNEKLIAIKRTAVKT